MLGNGREDMKGETVGLGKIHRDEIHRGFHQVGNEGDVTRQAVQLCNDQRGLLLPAGLEGGRELGAIVTLAGFNLSELAHQVPGATVQVIHDRLALGLEAETATALPLRRYPEISDETSCSHGTLPRIIETLPSLGILCKGVQHGAMVLQCHGVMGLWAGERLGPGFGYERVGAVVQELGMLLEPFDSDKAHLLIIGRGWQAPHPAGSLHFVSRTIGRAGNVTYSHKIPITEQGVFFAMVEQESASHPFGCCRTRRSNRDHQSEQK